MIFYLVIITIWRYRHVKKQQKNKLKKDKGSTILQVKSILEDYKEHKIKMKQMNVF